jgi:putative cell wall-binding protein
VRLRPRRIVIVGGEAAVSAKVFNAVRAAVPSAAMERRFGGDRYATAVEVSKNSFNPGAPVVYVATGLSFADALAGSAAAGRDGGPVLLVPGSGAGQGLPAVVAEELRRLRPTRVVILGGPAAISATVEAAVGAAVPATLRTRVAGADRYETAAKLATACSTSATVYLATGAGFADALVGAAIAGAKGCPMILTQPFGVPTSVRAALVRLAPRMIVVLGGPNAIDRNTETILAKYLTD